MLLIRVVSAPKLLMWKKTSGLVPFGPFKRTLNEIAQIIVSQRISSMLVVVVVIQWVHGQNE